MNRMLFNWMALAAASVAIAGAYTLICGPSASDIAAATAADLADAKVQASIESEQRARCRDLLGPNAQLTLTQWPGDSVQPRCVI